MTLNFPKSLAKACDQIVSKVAAAGGRAVLVGGCVRDALLGITPKDADMEVFGIATDQLEALLGNDYKTDKVGKAFSVYKVKGLNLDISIPRRESKSGHGHKGFEVSGDPTLSFQTAAKRRDFTINAIMWDPLKKERIDPYNGYKDLQAGILRHTSNKFSEDPLRVLRAMQFLARFKLSIAPETLKLCSQIESEGLPKERLFEEWQKLILKGCKPSTGLKFLHECGWIRYYPELLALIDCEQNPKWHPEGDVWTHTLHCMDAFALQRIDDAHEDLVVGLAVLCHDFGKPTTSFVDEHGRIRSPAHDIAGLEPTNRFLKRLTANKTLIHSVLPLVETHMRPLDLARNKASDSAIRRLARKVKRIDRLLRVVAADMGGRPPLSADFPAGKWLRERAEKLSIKDAAPKPIIMGRHLIELGIEPGPLFSNILTQCFEAQIDGKFEDVPSGLAYLQSL